MTLRVSIRKFYLKLARSILNLSQSSPSTSTFGEIGWIGIDNDGTLSPIDLLDLQLFRRILNAPQGSLPRIIVTKLMSANAPETHYMSKLKMILQSVSISWTQLLASPNYSPKRFAKKKFYVAASRQWQLKVQHSSSHASIYGFCSALKCQEYLSLPPFRGRTLLTKLRVNDLTLAGAGYNSNSLSIVSSAKPSLKLESILWFLARAYTRYVHCTILPFQCSWKLISNLL